MRHLVVCIGLLAVLLALVICAGCFVGDTSMVVRAAAPRDAVVPAAVDLHRTALCDHAILAK